MQPNTHQVNAETPRNKTRRGFKFIHNPLTYVTLVIVLLGLGLAVWWVAQANRVDSSRYQAVFLSNNQVYFGKLHGYYTGRPYLTDVYYFKGDSGTGTSSSAGSQQLDKMGKEVHGPENSMILNADTIMFVENLREDSNIAAAIKKDQQNTTNEGSSDGISR